MESNDTNNNNLNRVGNGDSNGDTEANNNQGDGNRRTNNNNPTGRNHQNNQNNENPLDDIGDGARSSVPMNMWGSPAIEHAVCSFLDICESQGWENNLFRNKMRFLNNNIQQMFSEGGPFELFNPLSAQVFGQRLSRLHNHFRELNSNHNNDPTGAEAEELPLWYGRYLRFSQFCDNQRSTRGNTQTQRENLNQIADQLGANQPPLGPGRPNRRSEIAADNPAQLRGPPHVGDGIRIQRIDSNVENNNPEHAQARRGTDPPGEVGNENVNNVATRRRRFRSNNQTRRSNRRRTDGATIHDEISESRDMMHEMAGSLANMTNAVLGTSRPTETNDPINQLTKITQQLTAISQMNPDRAPQIAQRLETSWLGLLHQFDATNNISSNTLAATGTGVANNNNHNEAGEATDDDDDDDEEPFFQDFRA
jgi:hypothetical protein